MFDAVRNQKFIVRIILVVLVLSFSVWGVGSYLQDMDRQTSVASVGSMDISVREFQNALNTQRERLQQRLGSAFNPEMLNAPELRQAVLDDLVNRRLLELHTRREKMIVTDSALWNFISTLPDLQEDGKFSDARYEMLVRSLNPPMSKAMFEETLRQDLVLQQLIGGVGESAMVSSRSAKRLLMLQLEERQVSEALIKPDQFLGEVKITPEAVKAYYEKNRKNFETPEQVRVEYVVLSRDAIAEKVSPTEAEIKAAYDAEPKRYMRQEERRASHILIKVEKDASSDKVAAARSKAEDILKQLQKNPDAFAELAKQYSEDPGSASDGGDLNFFGRNAMTKPFEDAVFALKENQLSGLVRTDYGFHIIRVTAIHPEQLTPLSEVKQEIIDELKRRVASSKFAEASEIFTNLVFEQADSLKPVADKLGLVIEKTGLFVRDVEKAPAPLNDGKLIEAIFSTDTIKGRHNTNAIDIGNSKLVSARVSEHKPAALRPFETVKAEIEQSLKLEEAMKLAEKDGNAKLNSLKKGENVEVKWGPVRPLIRLGTPPAAREILSQIFSVPSDKLPGYAGMAAPNGVFALYKVVEVKPVDLQENDPRVSGQRTQLIRLAGSEAITGYVRALRLRYKVKVNQDVLKASAAES